MPQEARKAMELDPNEKDGRLHLAMYHQWNGEYEQSQALLKQLLEADPLYYAARMNVGDNQRQMGDPAGVPRGAGKGPGTGSEELVRAGARGDGPPGRGQRAQGA